MLRHKIAAITSFAVLAALSLLPQANAEESIAASAATYSVTSFGADGSDTEDDTSAIQSALNTAKNSSSVVTINIPSGTYYISSHLRIFSNTYLKLASGATLKRTNDEDYLLVGANDSYTGTGSDYGLTHDITIDGGTWDGNVSDTTKSKGLVKIYNSQDVTIKNATFTNCCGTHFVLLTGVSGISVTDTTFKNFIQFTGTESSYKEQTSAETFTYRGVEALHIDYDDDTNLPSENAVVTGCTFTNLASGVGTHHVYSGYNEDNIKIYGNTFSSCYFYCINAGGFTNFAAYNNTATSCGGFLFADGTSGSVYSNTFSAKTSLTSSIYSHDNFNGGDPFFNAFRIGESSSLTLTSNTIKNATGNGIYVCESSKSTIKSSTISGSTESGICFSSAGTSSVSGNTISTVGSNGVSVKYTTLSSLSSNTIKNTSDNGIYLSSAKVTTASSNTVTTCGNNCVSMNGSQATFKSNKLSGSTYQGFYVSSGSKLTASSNTVYNCTKNAFMVTGCTSSSITSNTIYGCGAYDLYVTGSSSGITYKSNVSTKNKTKVDSGSSATISGNTAYVGKVSGTSYTAALSSVTLSWSKVTNATSYKIYEYNSSSASWTLIKTISSGSTTSYTVSSLSPNTTYKFKIQAYGALGGTTCEGEKSEVLTTKTKAVTVGTVSASSSYTSTASAVRINWSKVSDASGYYVYRYDSSSKEYKKITTISSGSTLTYKQTGLSAGVTYKYKVQAYRIYGGKTYTGSKSSAITTSTKPAKVTISSSSKSKTAVRLNWNKVTGATGYKVQMYKDGKWTTVKTITSGSTLTYKITGLKKGTSYKFRIRAYRKINGKTLFGAYSNTKKVTTKK